MYTSKGAEFILKVTEEIIKCDKNDEMINDVEVKSRGMKVQWIPTADGRVV